MYVSFWTVLKSAEEKSWHLKLKIVEIEALTVLNKQKGVYPEPEINQDVRLIDVLTYSQPIHVS